MCVWERELKQAFQEAVIRGQPFTSHTIYARIRELFSQPVDHKSVAAEFFSLIERARPHEWALITIPVVDEDGTPRSVWQLTPFTMLEDIERNNRIKAQKPTLIQRFLTWAGY